MSNGGGFNLGAFFGSPSASPNNAAIDQHRATGQDLPGAGGKPTPTGGAGDGTGKDGDLGNPNPDLNLDPNSRNPDGSAKPKPGSSPLDAFADLFKIDDKNQPPVNPLSQKLMDFDIQKFGAAVSKMDFTRTLNPELVQKALGGDATAFNQALNQAMQGNFAATMQMVVNVMEQAFNKNNGRFESVLGDRFKKFQLDFSRPENKALQHPAAQPVLKAMREHISSTNPGMSPDEISRKAEEYFLAMGDAMAAIKSEGENKDKNKGGPGGGSGEPDWTSFLEQGAKSL